MNRIEGHSIHLHITFSEETSISNVKTF